MKISGIDDTTPWKRKLKEMKMLADQYFKNGQYEKSKKILEKILEEAQGHMLE